MRYTGCQHMSFKNVSHPLKSTICTNNERIFIRPFVLLPLRIVPRTKGFPLRVKAIPNRPAFERLRRGGHWPPATKQKRHPFGCLPRDWRTRLPLPPGAYGCCQCAHWQPQVPTGHLHLHGFESLPAPPNRKGTLSGAFSVWWRLGDSNPRPHACEACALTS